MKLVDLMEVTRPTRSQTWQILTDNGYERIGAGSYGEVYQKPGADHVLKLFKPNDVCYQAFLNFIKRNPNPHFPKIIGKPIRVNDFYAVRLEALTPLAEAKRDKITDADLCRGYLYFIQYMEHGNEEGARRIAEEMNGYYHYAKPHMDDPDLDQINRYFQEFCKQKLGDSMLEAIGLISHLEGTSAQYTKNGAGCMQDIYPRNVMLRGSTLVIIDPIANRRG